MEMGLVLPRTPVCPCQSRALSCPLQAAAERVKTSAALLVPLPAWLGAQMLLILAGWAASPAGLPDCV